MFSLYELVDHMISSSANSAASVVWKELILMRYFGQKYPPTPAEEENFFKKFSASIFYQLINILSDTPIPQEVGDFAILLHSRLVYFN